MTVQSPAGLAAPFLAKPVLNGHQTAQGRHVVYEGGFLAGSALFLSRQISSPSLLSADSRRAERPQKQNRTWSGRSSAQMQLSAVSGNRARMAQELLCIQCLAVASFFLAGSRCRGDGSGGH
jgi:hypothetical protein